MAETNQGPVAQPWMKGDPPPGYYRLRMDCQFCGARNGFLWPDAAALPLGLLYEVPEGVSSGPGFCRRCGKKNQCIVMTEPKKPPPKGPEPWSY